MATFIQVAKVNEITPGDRKLVQIDDDIVAVFNVDGQFYAIADICTHDDGPLADGELNGHIIACPRHGATFDIRTGDVLSFPAVTPVPSYQVKVEGDDVLVSLD